jgi:transposase
MKRPEGSKGFILLPKRWVVERAVAWLIKCRRFRSDYEAIYASSKAMIRLAMIGVMLRRLRRT